MRCYLEVPVVAFVVAFVFLPLGAAPGLAQEWSAPGAPIFDCANAAARYDRMERGLGVQDDAIRRTKAQLEALERARAAGDREAEDQLMARSVDTVRSHASEELDALAELQAKALDLPGGSAARLKWMKRVSALEVEISALKKLTESFKAGDAYGTEIQRQSHTVVEHLKEANKLFVESGLAEEIGGKLAAAGGPLGVAAFEASLFALDYMVADMGSFNTQLEKRDLEDTLSNLEHGYSEVELKMASLKKDCPEKFGLDASTPSPETASTSHLTPPPPEPPSPPAGEAPAVSTGKKSGGNGARTAVAIVGAGVAVGGAIYAGKMLGDLAAMSSGTCVSNRFCIVSVMSSGCSCSGSVNGGCDWTGTTAGPGQGCGSGVPCESGLSCNNGRCEGSNGRCRF